MALISEPRGPGNGSVVVNLWATLFGSQISLMEGWTTIVWILIITLDTRPLTPFVISPTFLSVNFTSDSFTRPSVYTV